MLFSTLNQLYYGGQCTYLCFHVLHTMAAFQHKHEFLTLFIGQNHGDNLEKAQH